MKRPPPEGPPVEAERYELLTGPVYRFELDRRDFVKTLGAGLLVTVTLPSFLWPQQRVAWGAPGARTLDTRIHIAEDGRVTVMTGKVEVGQGIRTALAQAAAEELRVAPESVRIIMGDTDLVPDDGPTYGSMTTPYTVPVVRQAAAAAREHLLDLATAEWGAGRSGLIARNGRVEDPTSGRSATYGEITRGQRLIRRNGEIELTPASRWQVLGRPLRSAKGREIVTGAYRYPSDVRVEGMLHGKMLRPPAAGATRVSVDTSAAAALVGVTVVRDGDFVGVAAPSAAAAQDAVDAVRADWRVPSQPNDREIYDHLAGPAGEAAEEPRALAARYTVAYIAHCPLEPRAAVAAWEDGRVTVWTGTQIPFRVRREVARACGLPEDRVRVIMAAAGAAFGGKHTGEAAVEAAILARRAGRPVKVVWTREEEFAGGYLRPAGVIDIRGRVAADGALTAWEMHNFNSGPQALSSPWYATADAKTAFHPAASPLRQGSYRALAATANHFARESHLDDLAALVPMDPLAFRLQNLRDERLREVLARTAERFGWHQRAPSSPGKGFGLACGYDKGSYVACCAEVETLEGTGEVRVVRLTEGFECGAILNPDLVRSQVIGAMVQGLGGALFEEVRFQNGTILNPRFSAYRVPRFTDVPEIDVLLLDRKDLPPAGAGETPIVAVAPAIRNAIRAVTGARLRSLPLKWST